MKTNILKRTLSLVTLFVLLAATTITVADGDSSVQPRYMYTASINVGLSFSGGTAICSGSVKPSGSYNSSVTVTLYRQSDSGSWVYVTSWRGSATGSSTASAGGSVYVGTGKFKVVSQGIIGNGMERPSASTIRSN